jgi:hypothetical protein
VREKVRTFISSEIESCIREKTIPDSPALPVGYNPLEIIRGNLFHWVQVPFNSTDVWCQLRCLNLSQIESCGSGNMSNIELKNYKDLSKEEIIQVRNYQEALCKAVLNIPTFDEITILIGRKDFVITKKREELANIRAHIESAKDILSQSQIELLETETDNIELFIGFILPADTMIFLTRWAMGNDVSDIKKLTRERLLEAAFLARAGNNNPSDHLSGVFTDHNKVDINRTAWGLYLEYEKNRETEKRIGKRIVGGPKSMKRIA